jgi:hypothetical protein
MGGAGLSLAVLSRLATGGLVAAIWQGVLLSAVVALGLRLLPKTPAAVRFAIWFGVFALVALMPIAGSFHRGLGGAVHAPWLTFDSRWCLVVVGAWGMASLMRAATLLLAVFRVRALWKRATPLKSFSSAHRDETETAGASVNLGRPAELCVSDEVDRPTVIGFFAPKIVIPTWLVEKLSAAELEQIVLHESGHLTRADDWLNLLQKIALVAFPLNPALAWVERRLCFERELACDEHVLKATGAPKAYAACLANLAEHRLGRKGLVLTLGALGRESELGRRVGRILRRGELMRPAQAKLLLGGAMLCLLTAAAGLERCPQVVGFASAQQMNAEFSAPDTGRALLSGYQYQQVVFHAPSRAAIDPAFPSALHRGADLSLNVSPGHSLRSSNRVAPVVLKPVQRLSQTRAVNVSDVRSSRQRKSAGVPVVQWVLVTSWQREDGARVVLTSARMLDAGGPVAMAQSVRQMAPVENVQDQFHPYAAVPVRGGWLVFQL